MSEIVLQFCAFPSFWGRLIDYGTEGEVGHVDALTPDRSQLFGAQHDAGLGGAPAGVQFRPTGYVREAGGYNLLRVHLACTPAQHDRFWRFMKAQEGKPYDVKGILGFLAGRYWHDRGHWWCSQLHTAGLEPKVAGVFPNRLWTRFNRLTPQELLLVTSALGRVERVLT